MSETPTNRRWYQFTLRDLFLATTLIAVGAGCFALCLRETHHVYYDVHRYMFGVGVASVLIGAGLATPFHRKVFGAGLGLAGFIVYSMLSFLG